MSTRNYVDGYLIPIKKKDLNTYKKMAAMGRKVWTEHGALDYYECVSDDLKNQWGLSFAKLCKLKPSEVLIYAFITFRSKAHRNLVNKKAMSDPRLKCESKIFDMKRFAYGGFNILLSAKKD